MVLLKAREADRRASTVEVQATIVSLACHSLSLFADFTMPAWTTPGAIEAYIVMLHGNVLLKQGLRMCETVDGGVFFHSNLRPTTLTTPMPTAISIAHTSPIDSCSFGQANKLYYGSSSRVRSRDFERRGIFFMVEMLSTRSEKMLGTLEIIS